MEKYLYEENKDYTGDIKDFFEGLDTFNLDKVDSVKLDDLKDAWTEFYFSCVTPSYTGSDEELLTKVGKIFALSNSVEDKDVKEQLLDYAYNYIAKLKAEKNYSWSIEDGIDQTLKEIGLDTVDIYFIYKEYSEKRTKIEKLDWDEREKYKLIGNNFEKYYYFEGELFYRSSDTEGYHVDYYKIYLSTLKNVIVKAEKEHSNSSDWDTTKAKEVIALHEKELYEEEVNYYLDQVIEAMERLENVDSSVKCTITRADEVIEVSDQKVLRRNLQTESSNNQKK